jgi:hypothetical protein
MKGFKQFVAEELIVEKTEYDEGVSHNVTVHRGNQDHAVGKHLDNHHPHEDHAGYIHIHTSKDGRHKYHAQVESGAHDEGVNTHAHYIHHDTRTGKVQDIPSKTHADTGLYHSHKTSQDFAKHVEKHTGHKMDSESAEAVHHHHEVNAHEHAVATQDDHPEKLPKHIAHKGYNTPGFKDGERPKPSHHNVKYEGSGAFSHRVAKHQEDGI